MHANPGPTVVIDLFKLCLQTARLSSQQQVFDGSPQGDASHPLPRIHGRGIPPRDDRTSNPPVLGIDVKSPRLGVVARGSQNCGFKKCSAIN
jgi:hypothetical protein